MVPVCLELRNFLSYGEDAQTLDLTGMHTICLSGENGNGKSALLDAITWSLWGESRAGKNKHDELVRIGSDEMSVTFTFEMDDERYRVLRKRSKRAGGNQWELQQSDETGGWRSLTGNNAGETEKAIQRLLRMSYDTFLNSAYLRQGRADQFVQQTPGKRKEILAEILDLSRYDRLEAMAREKMRESNIDAIDVERSLNQIEAELAREESYKGELTQLEAQHEKLARLRQEQARLRDAARTRLGELQNKKNLVDQWERQRQADERDIAAEQRQIAGLDTAQQEVSGLLAQRESIDAQYAELQVLKNRESTLDARYSEIKPLAEEYARADREWLQQENNVRIQLKVLGEQHQQAKNEVGELPRLEAEASELRRAVDELPTIEQAILSGESERTTLQHRSAELRRDDGVVKAAITSLEARITDLKTQEGGRCAVCNSPLSPEKVAEALELHHGELAGLRSRQKEVWAEAKRVATETARVEHDVAQLSARRSPALMARGRLDALESRLSLVKDAAKRLEDLKSKGVELRKSLDGKTFAPHLRALLDRLRPSVDDLKLVEPELAAVRRRAGELAPFERKHAELSHAGERLDGLKADKDRAEARIAQRRESLEAVTKQLAEYEDVPRQVAAIEMECADAEKALLDVDKQDDRVHQEIGRVRQLLSNCETMRGRKTTLAPQLVRLRKDADSYEQLAKAFGKKGVQAIIIANAIPELQEHANDILSRLTDDSMHISFETLRESRTRRDEPIETLDIHVSDTMGTRPLEMYSGGEGFRAAFAIRIALSKLLAHRAGARLQTLIIDEGFGTQDGKGREKLIDALNALHDDFEKVIVITHIDEMKDAFAARIEVMKTALGSQLAIIEGSAG